MLTKTIERTVIAVLAGVFFLTPFVAHAGESAVGTYGAAFLRIPVGAKIVASSDAAIGLRPDASMVFSNPAFLSDLESQQVFFSSSTWLEDLTLTSAGYVLPLGNSGYNLSFGTLLMYSGGLKGYNDQMSVVSEDNYYDLGIRSMLSKRVGSTNLSLAGGVTYIRQHIPSQNGDGYSFTAGATYRMSDMVFHALAKDVGGRVSFSDKSYTVSDQYMLGVGRSFPLVGGHLDVGTQMVFSEAAPHRFQLSADMWFPRFFTLRGALDESLGAESDGLPISGGLGVRYRNMALDYSFTPHDYFPATHTFSFVFTIGGWGMASETPFDEDIDASGRREETPKKIDRETPKVSPETPKTEHALTEPIHPQQVPTPKSKPGTVYLVTSGTHSWMSSAVADARMLRLLNIPAVVDRVGDKYRVVIGRYDSLDEANKVIEKYQSEGHSFHLAVE